MYMNKWEISTVRWELWEKVQIEVLEMGSTVMEMMNDFGRLIIICYRQYNLPN
jgi:hypothetical protein